MKCGSRLCWQNCIGFNSQVITKVKTLWQEKEMFHKLWITLSLTSEPWPQGSVPKCHLSPHSPGMCQITPVHCVFFLFCLKPLDRSCGVARQTRFKSQCCTVCHKLALLPILSMPTMLTYRASPISQDLARTPLYPSTYPSKCQLKVLTVSTQN